ncbi:S4 domain-containing protein [Phenylobacterium sp.]|uniref:RNA-binding S4 domain-containing protein n=1 Tax=Phenylobacterium sp. TaxID=1871053 RepID=UPI0025E977EC|nr:S4 domain-containing protein [Phenylobacterium sp.]MCA3721498.1 RNA-binding S4 domain-containing protein [Phenylobacterium sp.]
MSGTSSIRADVWLWRARFFKSRSLAARFLDEGRVRLTPEGNETRIDKCARPLRIGDRLVFAVGGRLTAVEVLGFGERRGPPAEARTLYRAFEAQDEVGPGPA